VRSSARRQKTCSLATRRGAAFIGVLFLATAFVGCGREKVRADAPAPPEVVVAPVILQDVPVYEETVANLNGPVNAAISPKVQGYVLSQNYVNGSLVRKGQLLFQIDRRPFEAALDEAKADAEKAVSTLSRASNDVARDTPLAAQKAIPQKQLDDDIANETWAKAELKAKKAAQEQAQLNLGWTSLYSPVDGIAGEATSQVGDLVSTTTKMTTVSQIDPIWAYFNISETLYLRFAPEISRALRTPGGKSTVPVDYIQANDVPYPFKGRIIFVSREVATGTGTIQLAAAFPNRDAILRPGGFGKVRVLTGTDKNAMLVPQASVIEVQSQYQVIVVGSDGKATIHAVKVGNRVGPNWIITDGLNAGNRVVVEGIQKVQAFAAQSPEAAKEGVPVTTKPYASTAGGSN